jgi:predicted RNA binding protein YcfA (HicA-like mRNA interferase family)
VGRLATIQALRMIRALGRLGWAVVRVSGSHHILAKPGHAPVTVPVKKGATLKEGTARSILKEAGVTEDEFFEVY